MKWFVSILMAAISFMGTLCFATLFAKAVKHHENIPKLLCLLMMVAYAISTVFIFDFAFSRYFNSELVTLGQWNIWVNNFCTPQALLLITYLLFSRVLSFEPHEH